MVVSPDLVWYAGALSVTVEATPPGEHRLWSVPQNEVSSSFRPGALSHSSSYEDRGALEEINRFILCPIP